MGEGVIQDRLLHRFRHPVGMRIARAGQTVDQPGRAIRLKGAPDLIELLSAVADDLTGLRDITEIGRQIEQTELPACYLLLRGHVVLRSGLVLLAHHPDPIGSGLATPTPRP